MNEKKGIYAYHAPTSYNLNQNQAKLESELYGSGVGMIPVASKAIRGLGSSAYSAYKGVRRYLNKPFEQS
jgi:hypothetical protein